MSSYTTTCGRTLVSLAQFIENLAYLQLGDINLFIDNTEAYHWEPAAKCVKSQQPGCVGIAAHFDLIYQKTLWMSALLVAREITRNYVSNLH